MSQIEREYLHLSSGVDYIEYHYFDNNGNPTDSSIAKKCAAYECNKEGKILKKVDCRVVTKMDTALDRVGIQLPIEMMKKKKSKLSVLCHKWSRKLFR